MSETGKYGGYTAFRALDAEEQAMFKKLTEGIDGKGFQALAVSTAVINGVAYRFLSEATLVSPAEERSLVIIQVDKLVTGEFGPLKFIDLVEQD